MEVHASLQRLILLTQCRALLTQVTAFLLQLVTAPLQVHVLLSTQHMLLHPTQLGIILWYYTLIGLLCCEAFEHKYLTLKSSFARTASHQFVCQSLQDATPTAVTALYMIEYH